MARFALFIAATAVAAAAAAWWEASRPVQWDGPLTDGAR